MEYVSMDYLVKIIRDYIKTQPLTYEVLYSFLESLDIPEEELLKKFSYAIEEWNK